ncbi:Uncharacterized conserved protein, DUF1015 family [Lishizhenia tianjinensis]|uniref:Uncharacterized conserved protein, DUF1015 family n=1 Tax=Lishizhenia tianjinensis TaxID=477690 RepID=A0A1I6XSE7_9FLAO|nr:DUF1015 domain-containing protein [Lishizhenia tianjinensis]SFT40851.1 Uncharacterized conserved protein, DUF1015 family [Lishizhenia tianjinensis]
MAKLKAFKAVRPTRDKAHLVASRPYYTYKPNILEAKLEDNPYTFIHIINPEHNISEELRTEPNSPERFKNVRNVFEEFCAQGILQQEDEEALYVYQQTKNGHVYTGVIAGASVEEYNNDLIKKHEATLTEREEMFTNYLDIVGFNAEPVLISHRKDKLIDDLLEIICSARPEYEFCTADTVKHELWVVQDVLKEKLIEAYQSIEATYIADGHHRSASSALLSERLKERNPNATGDKNYNYILGFLIDETRLTILEFNRLVKTMNGHTPQEILSALEENFEVSKLDGACSPENMHEMHCCMDGNWYKLKCKPNILKSDDVVDQIDAQILTKYILSPIFDIKDLKTNKDINFISGEEGHLGVEREIAKGKYKVGFVLFPVTIDQVKAVADENKIMPPKSTWVEPKMRSGLTIYKINE